MLKDGDLASNLLAALPGGIEVAATRGAQPFDGPLDRKTALAVLARNVALEARFRQAFPFIA